MNPFIEFNQIKAWNPVNCAKRTNRAIVIQHWVHVWKIERKILLSIHEKLFFLLILYFVCQSNQTIIIIVILIHGFVYKLKNFDKHSDISSD
jgi:hypothetical protein